MVAFWWERGASEMQIRREWRYKGREWFMVIMSHNLKMKRDFLKKLNQTIACSYIN